MKTEDFLERLENVRPTGSGWSARCPSHEDRRSSLSVNEGDEGILVTCHAGCTPIAITTALGLELRDLFYEFPSHLSGSSPTSDEIEAIYTYEDAAGNPVFEVVRFKGKRFSQRLYGSTEWGLKGLENKPLFHLPQLLAADKSRRVYVVEGEKDVLALERAGAVATCSVGGAGKWNHNYAHHLRGRHVRIVADRDEPGVQHALTVLATLEDQAASVEIVQSRVGKDAYDHLTAGFSTDEFIPMPVGLDGLALTRFDSIDPEEVSWVEGWDGFFPYAGLTSLVGMPGVNKSTLTVKVIADVTNAGRAAMIIASEDAIGKVVRPRLEAAGADLSAVILVKRQFGRGQGHVVFPRDAEALLKNVEKEGVGIVVVDPIEAHLDTSVVANAHANATIRTALAPLAEVADAANAAVIMVGHPNKNRTSDPMMRAGGSIGIPGAARSALMMGNHPDFPSELGMRVLASYKGNWAERPQSRVFRVQPFVTGNIQSIRLESQGETFIQAYQLLKKGMNESE